MIVSGESLLSLARELKKREATDIHVCVTSALFTGASPTWKRPSRPFVQADPDHQSQLRLALRECQWFEEVDMAATVAAATDRLNQAESLRSMFGATVKIRALPKGRAALNQEQDSGPGEAGERALEPPVNFFGMWMRIKTGALDGYCERQTISAAVCSRWLLSRGCLLHERQIDHEQPHHQGQGIHDIIEGEHGRFAQEPLVQYGEGESSFRQAPQLPRPDRRSQAYQVYVPPVHEEGRNHGQGYARAHHRQVAIHHRCGTQPAVFDGGKHRDGYGHRDERYPGARDHAYAQDAP